MKFRVGKRHMWPLPTSKGQKELICRSDNFQDKTATRSRYVTERPARLLVNTGDIREVSCGLPLHLQGGVAFSEVGIHCGGCLKYDPQREPNKFVIRPVNCSEKPNKAQGEDSNSHTIHHHRTNNQPIEYSCLAHFTFHNSSHAVVTKTTSFEKGLGQYLVWIFTADNQIKVLKAADTFVFEKNRVIKSDLLQAQFTILRNNNMQCQQIVVFPRLSTPSGLDVTPRPNHRTSDFYDGIYGTGPPTSGGRYVTYNPMIVNRSNNDDPSKVSNPSSKPDVKPEGPPEPEKPGAVKGPENAAVGAHAQGRNWKRCAAMFLSVFVTLVAKHLMTSSRTVDTLVAVRVT
ncbi:uncharacterized protein LOC106012887 [Aplysia californica]|uniref:Uncharacterized protein LOC106012887 n=1 Tax=Aplysia californica TaxID=6500 RepID=A0ABM1A806_APLCA|nr:uncharacterized protein LOC106012887 [Aplysia californica]